MEKQVNLTIKTPKGTTVVKMNQHQATVLQTDKVALSEFIRKIHFEPEASNSSTISNQGASNVLQDDECRPQHNSDDDTNNDHRDDEDDATPAAAVCETGIWTKSSTLLLLELYRDKSKKMEKGLLTKKALWRDISVVLKEKGYMFSCDQVAGRWKTLMRAYKTTKDANRKSGNGRKHFEYETALDELLATDPAVTPSFTISSNSDTSLDTDETTAESEVPKTPPKNKTKRKRRASSDVIDTIEKMMESQQKRHDEKMDVLKSLVNVIGENSKKNKDDK